MFYVILITLLTTILLYYYRRIIFLKTFSLFLRICKWKIERKLKRMSRLINNISKKHCVSIKDTTFTDYDVVFNEKQYSLIFFSESDVYEFSNSINLGDNRCTTFDKRNLIVHASITDNSGEILFDITHDIRRFCFYFDKRVKLGKLFDFLEIKKSNSFYSLQCRSNVFLHCNTSHTTRFLYLQVYCKIFLVVE